MRITRTSRYRWLPVRIDDFEKWQTSLLEESARRLDTPLDPGGHVHRWGFVASPVMFRGQRAWLRVSPFLEHEMSGKAWRGTAEAAAIPGVSKPALLHRIEWHTDGPSAVPVSAEVLTLVTDLPASQERFLLTAPDLPADWFSDLRTSLIALHAYPTDRQFPVHDAEEYGYLLGHLPSAGPRRLRSGVRDRAHRPELAEHHSPTIHGGGEVLPSQSREMLRTRKPYTGCNAGITHFHADPHGKASICKVGRDPQVDLIAEGARRPTQAHGCRRRAAYPARRLRRLHPPEDMRDLHAASRPLPAG